MIRPTFDSIHNGLLLPQQTQGRYSQAYQGPSKQALATPEVAKGGELTETTHVGETPANTAHKTEEEAAKLLGQMKVQLTGNHGDSSRCNRQIYRV